VKDGGWIDGQAPNYGKVGVHIKNGKVDRILKADLDVLKKMG
jgi:hypothetical protein